MAKVKLKNIKEFTRAVIRDSNNKLRKNIPRAEKDRIETEILTTILQGRSPVNGERFVRYSKAYADREKGGSRKPVDMNLTGEMLDSLEVKQEKGSSSIIIQYTDKKAKWHDEGKGNLPVRRLLPRFNKGERFKQAIQRLIESMIRRALKR